MTSTESDDLAQLTKQGSSYLLFSLRCDTTTGAQTLVVRLCVVRCRQWCSVGRATLYIIDIPLCQVILAGSISRRTNLLTSCGAREAGSVLLIPRRWKHTQQTGDFVLWWVREAGGGGAWNGILNQSLVSQFVVHHLLWLYANTFHLITKYIYFSLGIASVIKWKQSRVNNYKRTKSA